MTNKAEMKRYMRGVVEDYVDTVTGEVSPTRLAEDTAWFFEHGEWLDDETHEVWDAAFEVSEAYESQSKESYNGRG